MTFGLNFSNMFNMNTMMNLGSMVGMGGFGFGGYSTGINPFIGSVFNFYGSSTGCCGTPNYSTRTCGNNNPWANGLGMMLGYGAAMIGAPLLVKGGAKLINNIKANSNSTKQAEAEADLKDTNSKLEAEYKKLGIPVGSKYKPEEDQVYIDRKSINEELTKLQRDKDTQDNDLKLKKDDYDEKEGFLRNAKQKTAEAESNLKGIPSDDPNRSALQAAYDAAVKAQAEAQKAADEAKDARDAAQKQVNETEAKIETKKDELAEAEKAVAAREKEVKEIKAEIAELEALQAKEQTTVDNVTLDILDGTKLGRTTADDFKKVYDLEDNQYGTGKDGKTYNAGDIKKADMKYLLSEYATLSDGDKKDNIRNYVLSNWDNFDSKIREDFKSAKEIMERDQKKKTQQA